MAGAKNEELWSYFGLVESELKRRGLLRSKNITAERGELAAIDFYNSTAKEAKLQRTQTGTKNVDATSRNGDRYAIKTVSFTTKSTGTFQADDFTKQTFDYLIVVTLGERYEVLQIIESSWKIVDKYKKFHKTMKAFNIPLSKKFKGECRIVFSKI